MDAKTKATVINNALNRIEVGEDKATILSDVFSAGYGYGLDQGHYDCDPENVG
jgi:hypothetical protein